MGVDFNFNDSIKHLVMAGSDMFLIPLSFESSHLYQFYSLAYGTIPIVKKTDDSVKIFENYTMSTNPGNVFIFNKLEPKAISDSIKKAIKIYKQREAWEKVILKAMKLNFSWKPFDQQFIKLYHKLMMTKRSK